MSTQPTFVARQFFILDEFMFLMCLDFGLGVLWTPCSLFSEMSTASVPTGELSDLNAAPPSMLPGIKYVRRQETHAATRALLFLLLQHHSIQELLKCEKEHQNPFCPKPWQGPN